MVESFEKRQRERRKRDKQADKRARRKDRAELKQARADGSAPPARDTSYADIHDDNVRHSDAQGGPAVGPERKGPLR
jgi:hypothetical protein